MSDSQEQPDPAAALKARYKQIGPELRRTHTHLDRLQLAIAYRKAAPSSETDRWKAEHSVGLDFDKAVRKIKTVGDLEEAIAEPINTCGRAKQDYPDVQAARKILEALITYANTQLPSEYHLSWEALSEKGRSR